MKEESNKASIIAEDVKTLHSFGYAQELSRRMSGFSNFAISLSIICILSGGINSFSQGLSSVGGASIGLGWPLGCIFSLFFALTMAQVASAFPTAGGLYHWASILGGKGWGWITAWCNLMGLIFVLAAVNVGTYLFAAGSLGPLVGFHPEKMTTGGALAVQIVSVSAITFSQALFNHFGIRLTTVLTDFSGYLILVVAAALTGALVIFAGHLDFSRLTTFTNYSGPAGGNIWPATSNLTWLFLLGLLLPAFTITGFDASAHTSEETINAARNVPRGIVRSVVASGVFGWIMLAAIVLAAPSLDAAAAKGGDSFGWIIDQVLPGKLSIAFCLGIALSQYLCGLATLTSASRMAYAFARDGGLPCSRALRTISPKWRTPSVAIWVISVFAIAFTVYTPAYSTISAACAIFVYISYVIPTGLGLFAYGRTWTKMGPWDIGKWYRLLAVLCLAGCAGLIVIGVQPPNDKNLWIVLGSLIAAGVIWFAHERRRFQGPPQGIIIEQRRSEINAAEKAVGERTAPL